MCVMLNATTEWLRHLNIQRVQFDVSSSTLLVLRNTGYATRMFKRIPCTSLPVTQRINIPNLACRRFTSTRSHANVFLLSSFSSNEEVIRDSGEVDPSVRPLFKCSLYASVWSMGFVSSQRIENQTTVHV
jgi:hypothetical protein